MNQNNPNPSPDSATAAHQQFMAAAAERMRNYYAPPAAHPFAPPPHPHPMHMNMHMQSHTHMQALAAVHQAAAAAGVLELTKETYAMAVETLRRHHSAAMALIDVEKSTAAEYANLGFLQDNFTLPAGLGDMSGTMSSYDAMLHNYMATANAPPRFPKRAPR